MALEVENLLQLDGVGHLFDAAEVTGTVLQSDIVELCETHELDPLETDALYREIEQRGLEVVEAEPRALGFGGAEPVEVEAEKRPVAPVPPQPLETTTDALQLFLREAGR